ncbi:hypothetical protein HanRHA438_Chr16g0761571 [Helianthus annuus]|nr:hypothetical protein HanRHA438_Chr16g0761571 [Helianthus annuus]
MNQSIQQQNCSFIGQAPAEVNHLHQRWKNESWVSYSSGQNMPLLETGHTGVG